MELYWKNKSRMLFFQTVYKQHRSSWALNARPLEMQNCPFLKWKAFPKLLPPEDSIFYIKRNGNMTQSPWHMSEVKEYCPSEDLCF